MTPPFGRLLWLPQLAKCNHFTRTPASFPFVRHNLLLGICACCILGGGAALSSSMWGTMFYRCFSAWCFVESRNMAFTSRRGFRGHPHVESQSQRLSEKLHRGDLASNLELKTRILNSYCYTAPVLNGTCVVLFCTLNLRVILESRDSTKIQISP